MADQKLSALTTQLTAVPTPGNVRLYVADAGESKYALWTLLNDSFLQVANDLSDLNSQQTALDTITAVSGATDEHVLTKDTATGNATFKAAAGGNSLPVVDETAIVFKTGAPTETLTFDIDAYTAARVVTLPDAALTVAGLEVANVFTAAQTIDGVSGAVSLTITRAADVNFSAIYADAPDSSTSMTATFAGINLGNSNNADGVYTRMNFGPDPSSAAAAIATKITDYANAYGTFEMWTRGETGFAKRFAIDEDGFLGITAVTSDTNSVQDIITTRLGVDGTPTTGLGQAILFTAKSSTTGGKNLGRLSFEWATATHATRKALGKLTVYDIAEREAIRWEADGSAARLGFYGTTAVAQPAHIVDADGTLADITTKFNQLLADLAGQGLQASA